jgi:hypothetical protein
MNINSLLLGVTIFPDLPPLPPWICNVFIKLSSFWTTRIVKFNKRCLLFFLFLIKTFYLMYRIYPCPDNFSKNYTLFMYEIKVSFTKSHVIWFYRNSMWLILLKLRHNTVILSNSPSIQIWSAM